MEFAAESAGSGCEVIARDELGDREVDVRTRLEIKEGGCIWRSIDRRACLEVDVATFSGIAEALGRHSEASSRREGQIVSGDQFDPATGLT